MNHLFETIGKRLTLPLIQIPAGEFLMGSPADGTERYDDEGPQHRVRLDSFLLGRTPVTQEQWAVVARWPKVDIDLDSDPSHFKGPRRPVERVSWDDAVEFCQRLSQRTGRFYTLPSEAQWEYACRAGTTTPFAFGDTLTPEMANYNASATTDVVRFPANAWGLHDMHGNVCEWCADDWHDRYDGAPQDGTAWLEEQSPRKDSAAKTKESNGRKLLRGGSWYYPPRLCRSAYRYDLHPDDGSSLVGFRVCCTSFGGQQ